MRSRAPSSLRQQPPTESMTRGSTLICTTVLLFFFLYYFFFFFFFFFQPPRPFHSSSLLSPFLRLPRTPLGGRSDGSGTVSLSLLSPLLLLRFLGRSFLSSLLLSSPIRSSPLAWPLLASQILSPQIPPLHSSPLRWALLSDPLLLGSHSDPLLFFPLGLSVRHGLLSSPLRPSPLRPSPHLSDLRSFPLRSSPLRPPLRSSPASDSSLLEGVCRRSGGLEGRGFECGRQREFKRERREDREAPVSIREGGGRQREPYPVSGRANLRERG